MENNRNIEEITFFGGQNSDVSLTGIPKGDFLYALNILNQSSGVGNKGIVTTPKGNLEVIFELPDGINKTIGKAEDHENNKFYFFNWNANGFHGIYQFDGLTVKVNRVLLNLTDTGGFDIMRLNKDFYINHADVVRNNLLYWVDGFNNARKTNIDRLFDKTDTGYGPTVLEEFINAYKRTADYAPTVVYASDTSKAFNKVYGALRRFASRYTYRDGEKSNWSDFSAIALPDKEAFTGEKTIPTNNNRLDITTETGNSDVELIEIAMQSTAGENNSEGLLNWELIATLNKKHLKIADNVTYTYKFYNDSVYPVTPYEKIIRPYNFLPRVPNCQAIAKSHMLYAGGKEGREFIPIEITASVSYVDLFIDNGTENKFNEPVINAAPIPGAAAYLRHKTFVGNARYVDLQGKSHGVTATKRANSHRVTIGHDVKTGNEFVYFLLSDRKNYTFRYPAKNTDTATTVANKLKADILATNLIILSADGLPARNIYNNETDNDGNVSFEYSIMDNNEQGYYRTSGSVNPISYSTLKDTGQSVSNEKLGSTKKYGIIYQDFDDPTTLTYTNDGLIVNIATINELGGFKTPIVTLEIKHKPPVWARFYQIVRSNDLVYGDYIQLLIQKIIDVQGTTNDEYQDLVVGSLVTYNKIHPNSTLQYSFEKGDRIRLIQKTVTGEYYDFFETEILEFLPTSSKKISSNITTNGSTTVTVAKADIGNVGRSIVVEGSEREIIGAPNGTTYELSAPLGETNAKTYLFYDLVDNRGIIKIRKPSVIIDDLSTVEIYKPASGGSSLLTKQFYQFQKKFPILNAGTESAYHGANQQNQTETQPALVKIDEGTAYVRNREMPVTTTYPGAQVVIVPIEDPSFSDFYPSLINDNGRTNIEDQGKGEMILPDRYRFSNNSLENTALNGLGDFDGTDYEDYFDKFGDTKRLSVDDNNVIVFKALHSGYIPLNAKVALDDAGLLLRAGSPKLLNPLQYFSYAGGIGNNAEAFCANGPHKYTIYANAGVVIRIGANGEEPISKTFNLDAEVKALLSKASANKAKIVMEFNQLLGLLVISIEGYNQFIYANGLNGWNTKLPELPDETIFQIVTGPTNGSVTLTGTDVVYTPNTDYQGSDSFTYRAFINGAWSTPVKICVGPKETPQDKAWRPFAGARFCVLSEFGLRNGFRGYTTLEEYFIYSGLATGVTKPNLPEDANYVEPIYEPAACTIEPPDPNPNPFTYTPIIDAELTMIYDSNSVTIGGINVPSEISIANGEYQINGGDWTNVDGTILNGQSVKVRNTSSTDELTKVTTTLIIGNYSADFDITTKTVSVACGVPTSYPGGEAFPAETIITLGSGLGLVVLNFDGYNLPDKFIIEFDGVEVVNTGYRGDTSQQAALNAALASKGLPSETITGPGKGVATFNKTTTKTTAIVKVFAPQPGTAWEFQLGCPGTEVPNTEQSQSFQRNNCGTGKSGTWFNYVIPAGTFYGATTDDANNKALTEIATNGQTKANLDENASCILNTVISTFVIDIDNDIDIDCCLYIDTPGIAESGNIVSVGQNFYEAGVPPENAFMLASDKIVDTTTRRFETGIGKLINLYPDATAVPQFIYKLRGRSSYNGTLNGNYALKFPNQKMTMIGSPGSYIPSITPSGGPTKTPWSGPITNGRNGTVGVGVGSVIKTFTYDRESNTIIVS